MTHKTQRGILIAIALVLIGLALFLILSALDEEISFYKTPKEIGLAQLGASLRVGGFVEKKSVRRQGTTIYFTITDFEKKIKVRYRGIVPDLFREGQGVIAEGKLEAEGQFVADKIFAKHDENYRPPILKDIKK
jgi:cytochrome c-type biogenesis protein CcmE